MIWLNCKIRGEEKYYEITDDITLTLIYIIVFMITFTAAESTCGKGETIVVIAVGLIGVGIVVSSVSAVVCKWFDYMKEKKRIEAECFKYEVSESLKYGRYRGKWVFEKDMEG